MNTLNPKITVERRRETVKLPEIQEERSQSVLGEYDGDCRRSISEEIGRRNRRATVIFGLNPSRSIPSFALTLLLSAGSSFAVEQIEPKLPEAIVQEISARADEMKIPAAYLLAPVRDAAIRGLPPELIAAKVLEGASKAIPSDRIIKVANDLLERLSTAEEVLAYSERSELAAPRLRKAALQDLGAAFGAGIQKPTLEFLVRAAKESGNGNADSVVSAALVLGELSRKGIALPESIKLGMAIARKGSRPPGEIIGLFEMWKKEGGRESKGFIDEAAGRIERGNSLEGMIDYFGDSPNRVVNGRALGKEKQEQGVIGSDIGKHGADKGLGPGERSNSARSPTPALDDVIRGNGNGNSKNSKKDKTK